MVFLDIQRGKNIKFPVSNTDLKSETPCSIFIDEFHFPSGKSIYISPYTLTYSKAN